MINDIMNALSKVKFSINHDPSKASTSVKISDKSRNISGEFKYEDGATSFNIGDASDDVEIKSE